MKADEVRKVGVIGAGIMGSGIIEVIARSGQEVVFVEVSDEKVARGQGAVEKSNVRPVIEMTRMIELTRAYTEVATLLQQQSDLRKNSIQQLAEVPA